MQETIDIPVKRGLEWFEPRGRYVRGWLPAPASPAFIRPFLHGNNPNTTGLESGRFGRCRNPPTRLSCGQTEPVVLVPVLRRVPIAVRRTAVPAVVVPAAAAEHAVRGLDQFPLAILTSCAANASYEISPISEMPKPKSIEPEALARLFRLPASLFRVRPSSGKNVDGFDVKVSNGSERYGHPENPSHAPCDSERDLVSFRDPVPESACFESDRAPFEEVSDHQPKERSRPCIGHNLRSASSLSRTGPANQGKRWPGAEKSNFRSASPGTTKIRGKRESGRKGRSIAGP